MTKRLVLEALEMAVGRRHPRTGPYSSHGHGAASIACGDYQAGRYAPTA